MDGGSARWIGHEKIAARHGTRDEIPGMKGRPLSMGHIQGYEGTRTVMLRPRSNKAILVPTS